jgi:hypothetical protein
MKIITEQYMNKKKEVNPLNVIKYWDYTEVLEVHETLQKANESINIGQIKRASCPALDVFTTE